MKNRSAYAFTLLLVLSCGDNPSDPGNIPYSDFDIFIPNGDSQWMLWETGVPVEYDVTAIQDSYLIKLELVKNDTLTTDFGDWVFNTGSATVKAQVPDTLGMGNNYRLRILTVEGDTAYSASFSIQGYSLGEFVEVPAGSFLMGSLEEEWYHQPSEAPAHTVTFENSFEILGNEVMQATWENVMGNNPSNWGTDSFPVESVSWNDCQVFVETLSAMDSLYNYRLPSEAEWEYACRAGTGTWYYWGNNNSPDTVSQYAWYSSSSSGHPHWTSTLEPNSWNLYDMSGNVFEWCQDVYHENYEGAPADGSAWVTGGLQGYRVQRGGSWSNNAQFLRNATRSKLSEGQVSISTGFRVIREIGP
ncbi:MAG: formylglycine-generating enzyme family protein [Candidatus Fermentibacteraceae bacterium]|nr:formylglycine-generating enzyme family protein [Candidatus Fermentibacteraceae bacterium]